MKTGTAVRRIGFRQAVFIFAEIDVPKKFLIISCKFDPFYIKLTSLYIVTILNKWCIIMLQCNNFANMIHIVVDGTTYLQHIDALLGDSGCKREKERE